MNSIQDLEDSGVPIMNIKPIIFNASMVRALLDGRKTQTRRLLKSSHKTNAPHHPDKTHMFSWDVFGADENDNGVVCKCPFGQAGDLLYVRETTKADEDRFDTAVLSCYAADGEPVLYTKCDDPAYNGTVAHWNYPRRVRPSIHMPRWASRLTLRITDVRVERVQDISEDDCDAEMFGGDFPDKVMDGYEFHGGMSLQECFARVWNSIYNNWDDNPWVWCVSFEVIHKNVDDQ